MTSKYTSWTNWEELQKLEEIIDALKRESAAMYGAISDASEMGNDRCRVELDRIANSDVLRWETVKESLYEE